MKKQYPYRFKTKEEFIKKYGVNWRYNNPNWNFVQGMDYLLGKDYPYDVKLDDDLAHFDGWGIASSFLISTKSDVPNYKGKKIVKEL